MFLPLYNYWPTDRLSTHSWAFFSAVAVASTQSFFTYRCFAVSGKKNYPLIIGLGVLIVAGFAVQVRLAVFDIETELTLDLADAKYLPLPAFVPVTGQG
jgi:hypothetical protein